MKYVIAGKAGIVLSVCDGRETRQFSVFPGDGIMLEVDGADLYATNKEGKRYKTIDHAQQYIAMGWIVPEEEQDA